MLTGGHIVFVGCMRFKVRSELDRLLSLIEEQTMESKMLLVKIARRQNISALWPTCGG